MMGGRGWCGTAVGPAILPIFFMGARGTKPEDNLSSKIGELTPLAVKAPAMKGGKMAQDEYVRLAKELAKLGHLSDINRQSLVNYCEAFAQIGEAWQEVQDEGTTLVSGESGNKYMNPALSAISLLRGIMETEAKNLGMTPMSLQSIKNVKPPKNGKKEGGPSDFLTGGG